MTFLLCNFVSGIELVTYSDDSDERKTKILNKLILQPWLKFMEKDQVQVANHARVEVLYYYKI